MLQVTEYVQRTVSFDSIFLKLDLVLIISETFCHSPINTLELLCKETSKGAINIYIKRQLRKGKGHYTSVGLSQFLSP